MAEAGKDPGKGESGPHSGKRKKDEPTKKARKARAPRRGKKPDGRRRAELISAIDHPLRRRILRVLHDRDEAPSPNQIAKELDMNLGTVAYHVRVLWRLGAVAPAGEQQVRGAMAHFYDSTIEDDPPIETLLDETREVDDGEIGGKKRGGKKKGN